MGKPGNTAIARKDETEENGPDLLSDPNFVPCRNESCSRRALHAEHEVTRVGRKIHSGYDRCPDCQTPLVVTKTRRHRAAGRQTRDITKADCPNCGWSHTKALKASKEYL